MAESVPRQERQEWTLMEVYVKGKEVMKGCWVGVKKINVDRW